MCIKTLSFHNIDKKYIYHLNKFLFSKLDDSVLRKKPKIKSVFITDYQNKILVQTCNYKKINKTKLIFGLLNEYISLLDKGNIQEIFTSFNDLIRNALNHFFLFEYKNLNFSQYFHKTFQKVKRDDSNESVRMVINSKSLKMIKVLD